MRRFQGFWPIIATEKEEEIDFAILKVLTASVMQVQVLQNVDAEWTQCKSQKT